MVHQEDALHRVYYAAHIAMSFVMACVGAMNATTLTTIIPHAPNVSSVHRWLRPLPGYCLCC